MIVRTLEISDLAKAKAIKDKFYPELELPNFMKGLCSFVVGDDIIYAMVRPCAEITMLTDKDKPMREKREALYQVLDVAKFVGSRHGYNELLAFTNDEKYVKTLLKRGFQTVTQHAVVIDI